MSDWKIICLKCGKETTYSEIDEKGGCPDCGGGDFKVVVEKKSQVPS